MTTTTTPDRPMRIYIAGPMSGLPDFNYPAFNQAEQRLLALGYEVENPANNPDPLCGTWLGYMRLALRQISTVDALVMLPGWKNSRGARVEKTLADGLGLPVYQASELIP